MRRLPLVLLVLLPFSATAATVADPLAEASRLLDGNGIPAARLLLRDFCLAEIGAGRWGTVLAAATLLQEKTGSFPEYYRPWLEQAVAALLEHGSPEAVLAAGKALILQERTAEATGTLLRAGERLAADAPGTAIAAARLLATLDHLEDALQLAVDAGRSAERRRDAAVCLEAARFLLEHGLCESGRRFANHAAEFSSDRALRDGAIGLLELHAFTEDAAFWKNRTADGKE